MLVCLAVSASLVAASNKFFVRRSMSGAFLCAGFGLRGNGAYAVAPDGIPYEPFSGYESLERVIACYDVTVLKEVTSIQKGT